jgi:hypothetical protein
MKDSQTHVYTGFSYSSSTGIIGWLETYSLKITRIISGIVCSNPCRKLHWNIRKPNDHNELSYH